MEITWYGKSCFRLTERSLLTVVTDPFASKDLKLKADVITVSVDTAEHNNVNAVVGAQRGDVRVIRSPGEYEMGGVFVTGVAMKSEKKAKDGDKDKKAEASAASAASAAPAAPARSVVYSFNYEGINVAHLGNLSFVPNQSQVDALETVDVLLVPIGSEHGLNAVQAAEVISLIEPSIVIPMHYDGKTGGESLTKFLKEMGLSNAKSQDVLKVTKSGLPEDTQVMLLEVKE